MSRLIFILSVSVGSIVFGYIVQRPLAHLRIISHERLRGLSKYIKILAFFFLNPIAIVSTFWKLSLQPIRLVFFPILGILSALLGGAMAILFIKTFKLPPKKAASVFTSGMFTNTLTFGGLIGYVLFRDFGYMLAQLYTMLVAACYYLIGYPVSNNIGKGESSYFRVDLEVLKSKPFLFIPPVSITAGLILNALGIPRPEFLGFLIGILVPCVSALLGFSIGISLRFATIGTYKMEISLVMLIKFLIVPVVMIPVGLLLGLQNISDAIPFKMLIVLSFMPVAFNALVPPAIFGFDLDLANSAWIVTTASLVVIIPILYATLT